MTKKWGAQRVSNEITRVRSVFKFAVGSKLIDRAPAFGLEFAKPSAKAIRKERAKKGPRMFEPSELRQVLDTASPQLRAMLFLGINAGFGCTDVATLPAKAVDLKNGWVTYPRVKTGVERRVPLWPETVAAIQAAVEASPDAKGDQKSLLFISQRGKAFGGAKQTHWLVSGETVALLKRLKLHRPGLGFYSCRHTLQTIGEECHDMPAVAAIMGHVARTNDMASRYRERIADDRLKAVTDHLRHWLFGDSAAPATGNGETDGKT